MTYQKPEVLNTKRASVAVMGQKVIGLHDNKNTSSVVAYRSDE